MRSKVQCAAMKESQTCPRSTGSSSSSNITIRFVPVGATFTS